MVDRVDAVGGAGSGVQAVRTTCVLRDCNPVIPRLDGSPSSEVVYGMLRGEWKRP